MYKLSGLSVSGTEVPDDAGDVEEEWFTGTCLIYSGAFSKHISTMVDLCSSNK